MALVDYVSSDDEKTPSTTLERTPSLKRKRDSATSSDLPPLPSKFYDLYASTTRLSTRDDPALHGGRTRATPHVQGNWPTHLYIEWFPSTAEYDHVNKLISTLKDALLPVTANSKIESFLANDLGVPLPLHISLSRPIGLATEQKDSFSATLHRTIQASGVRPFDVSFSGLDWVANLEKTRWFLVLRVQNPISDGLNKLLYASNTTVQGYGQPPLYSKRVEDPELSLPVKYSERKSSISKRATINRNDSEDLSEAFHVSIAWTLEAPSQRLIDLTRDIEMDSFAEVRHLVVNVEEMKSKVGNHVTSISLKRSVVEGKELFSM